MRGTTRGLAVTVMALGMAAAPGAARAGDTCLNTSSNGEWILVLQKLKLKPGKSGPVSGYAVRVSDSHFQPISGAYTVFPNRLHVGLTRWATGSNPTGTGITTYDTTFHSIVYDLEFETGGDYSWTSNGIGGITNSFGDVLSADCAALPKIPKSFPQ